MRQLIAAVVFCLACKCANAQDIQLDLPIDCKLNVDCFVQSYVDTDPGPGAKDFACGHATNDGHKGTDFRLVSFRDVTRNVPVIASAAGRVTGTRDGVPDALFEAGDKDRLVGRECGNGVVIDHGKGWVTQYCHLKRSSIAVSKGDVVRTGQQLGSVGSSGMSAFAHVHLSVRYNKKIVDPFIGIDDATGCSRNAGLPAGTLWSVRAQQGLLRTGVQVIELGFTGERIAKGQSERGIPANLTPVSPALLTFARLINPVKGDVIKLALDGPDGFRIPVRPITMPRNKASYMVFTGKKRRATRWPAGDYVARISVLRGGRIILARQAGFTMPD
ncbi:MAG: M23 family metallopeptidase [Hyphomicrobiaceae bacterium]